MKYKNSYSLVVNKSDVPKSPREDTTETPVFPVRGIEVSIETTKGPVTFIPMFFSKKEMQKVYNETYLDKYSIADVLDGKKASSKSHLSFSFG